MPASQTIQMPDVEWLYIFPPLLDTSPVHESGLIAYQSDDLGSVFDAFQLRWRVIESSVLAKISESECLTVPSHKAICRLHNQKVLGMVSSSTPVVHHLELFHQIEPFLGSDSLLIDGGGQIYGGRIVMLRAQATLLQVNPDITLRVLLSMSYDGTRPPSINCFAGNRTWGFDIPCGNVPVKVVGGMPQVCADLMEHLEAIADETQTKIERAANVGPTQNLDEFWRGVYGKRQLTTVRRLHVVYERLLEYYEPSNWLAAMAVCVYEDYKLYFSAQEQDRRADQCLFGIGAKIKQRALNLASGNQ